MVPAAQSWLVSYAPSEKPRYAVVMMVSQGGTGSLTSGPSVRKIYESLFGVVGNKVDPLKSILDSIGWNVEKTVNLELFFA